MIQEFNNSMNVAGQLQQTQGRAETYMDMLQQPAHIGQQQVYGYTNQVPPASGIDQSGQKKNVASNNLQLESFQIQTPPPTRGSSAKRRSVRALDVRFGTPSTIATKTPQLAHHNTYPDTSSIEVSQPGFSAATALQFSDFGPATAPPILDQKEFSWNNTAVQCSSDNLAMLEDPFIFKPLHKAQSPTKNSQGQQQHPSRLASLRSVNGRQYTHSLQGPSQSHQRTGSSGVDPSLVYSSPGAFTTSRLMLAGTEGRVPYEQQLHDSRRELENSRSRRPSQYPPRSNVLTSSMNPPSRPSLHRSSTTGGSRSASLSASNDLGIMLSRSNTTPDIPRNPSPLKRVGRPLLSSISETSQTRTQTVVLTVDANGRARTETRVIDPSPARSVRERYPSLWDDSDSGCESDASTHVSSRNASFTFPKRHERTSKVARLDPDLEGLQGLSLPRPSSSASLRTPSKAASAAAAQLRRQSSARKAKGKYDSSRRSTLASLNNSFVDLASTLAINDDGSSEGDAAHALRQVVEERAQQQGMGICLKSSCPL